MVYSTGGAYFCVSDTFCAKPEFQGDGWCDDDNNIASCDYDEGDCCGDPTKPHYCVVCACHHEGVGDETATFTVEEISSTTNMETTTVSNTGGITLISYI